MSQKLTRVLFALWVLLTVALSLAPLNIKFRLGTVGPWHSTGHALIFIVTTVLACWTVTGVYARLLCCVGVTGIAMALEGMEKVKYRIAYEWQDVRADSIGIFIGFLLMLWLQSASSTVKRV